MATTPGPVMEFLGHVAYEMHQMKPLLPTYIHLLVSAIFPIYTAAHASLARPSSAAPLKKRTDADVSDLQDEEISPTIEALTPSDAILFPVLAGSVLASLYFIIKWLEDPVLLNYYLGLYFAVVGLFFAVKFVKDGLATIRSVVLPNQYSYKGKLWKLKLEDRHFASMDGPESSDFRSSPLPGIFSNLFQRRNSIIWAIRNFVYLKMKLKVSLRKLISITTFIDALDLTAILIATPLVWYHTFVDKPWFLTNILGFSFCYGSLQITTPGTSWTGTLLLSALFFYDIYFVFFTPMMVTVATKLDIPIKLLFPRPDGCVLPVGAEEGSEAMKQYLKCLAKKRTMAMLGLGDIVVPGMMLAFALRFDLYLYYRKLANAGNETPSGNTAEPSRISYLPATGSWGERLWTSTKLYSPELQAKRFPKTYFNASVVGYILGMITTVVVMQVSQHAQPALLYLVPGVLISLWGVACVKGDFKALWNYSEVPEEEKKDDKKDQPKKEDEIKEGEDGILESNRKTETSKDKKTKGTKTTTQADKKNVNNTTEDETHLILISLTLATTNAKATSKQPIHTTPEPSPTSTNKETSSPSTDEFSISSDEVEIEVEAESEVKDSDSDGSEPELIRRTLRPRRTPPTATQSATISPEAKGSASEPAVKRRRKA